MYTLFYQFYTIELGHLLLLKIPGDLTPTWKGSPPFYTKNLTLEQFQVHESKSELTSQILSVIQVSKNGWILPVTFEESIFVRIHLGDDAIGFATIDTGDETITVHSDRALLMADCRGVVLD
jgi:hypothetical protein